MASVQYDNSAFYLLVLALLCMYLASMQRKFRGESSTQTCVG